MTDLYIYTFLVFILGLAFGYLIGFLYAYKLFGKTEQLKNKEYLTFANPSTKEDRERRLS